MGSAVAKSGLRPAPPFFFLRFLARFRESGILLATVVLVAIFWVKIPYFGSLGFWAVILNFTARVGIIGVGMTILFCSQEFDLSVGSVFALVPVIVFVMVQNLGVNVWIAVPIGIAASMLCGVLNGLIRLKLNVNSLITTLGTMYLYQTIALVLSVGGARDAPADPIFRLIFGGQEIPIAERVSINTSGFWLIAVAIVGAIVLHKTRYGNWTLATGGNVLAARAAGINTNRVKMINFVITSTLAGLAGLIFATSVGTVYAVYGAGMELQTIAACVLGGTALGGGVGTILGTIVGGLVLAVINLGVVSVNWFGPSSPIPSAYLFGGAVGALIVFGMGMNEGLDRLRRRIQWWR